MLRWLAASLIIVAVAIGAYVLGTFYPNSRVQQAPVIPTQTVTITPTQSFSVPVATVTPQETVVPVSQEVESLPLPQVDPQQAMAYALVQAGINTSSPGGQYLMSRATAVQGMYEIHAGNFTSYSSQDLAAFMKGWVDKSNMPISSDYVQDWRQRVDSQIPAEADAILRSTAEGTVDDEFRRMVAERVQRGEGTELTLYWDHLVFPALTARHLMSSVERNEQQRLSNLYTQYQAASFAGQASDFGIFLVQQGYRLSKD